MIFMVVLWRRGLMLDKLLRTRIGNRENFVMLATIIRSDDKEAEMEAFAKRRISKQAAGRFDLIPFLAKKGGEVI